MAALGRGFGWAGKTDGDRHAVLWGAPFDISREEKFVNRVKNTLWRKYFFPAFDMTEENMQKTAEGLRKVKPKMLEGYTDALYFFAGAIVFFVRASRSGIGGSGSLGTGSYQNEAHDQSSCVSCRPCSPAIC